MKIISIFFWRRYLQRALASEQDPWALFFRGLPSIFLWKLHSPDYFDDFMALACVLGITLSAIGIVDVTLGKVQALRKAYTFTHIIYYHINT